jgi:hypothetical protein
MHLPCSTPLKLIYAKQQGTCLAIDQLELLNMSVCQILFLHYVTYDEKDANNDKWKINHQHNIYALNHGEVIHIQVMQKDHGRSSDADGGNNDATHELPFPCYNQYGC